MYLGDFGKVIFLTKNREDAKTKKQKAKAEKKIKEFTTEYGNRFKKDGNLKKEFESKYVTDLSMIAGVLLIVTYILGGLFISYQVFKEE